MSAHRKSKYQFLDQSHLAELGSAVAPLDGTFLLLPPKFEPMVDKAPLADGEPPTEVGWQVMNFWADANQVDDPYLCPTGLVRAVEAVSANSAANSAAIRAAMPNGRVRWNRNQAGRIASFTIEALVPMVGPATVQPRGISKATQRLREKHGQTTIHEIGEGLIISGQSAQHLMNIRDVQREVLDPSAYTGEDRIAFVDSLATQGILEPLRGFTYSLMTPDGAAIVVENDDGTTRTSTAQEFISILTGGLPADFSRLPWDNGDGTLTPRDWTPDSIREAFDAMRFEAASGVVDVWPPTETAKGVASWADGSSLVQQAIIRLMTAQMTIGIEVEPHPGNSTSMVVWSDMARFHEKAHQPRPWSAADNEAFKARSIVSDLAAAGHITADERAVMLGEVQVPWRYDATTTPYKSRIEAVVDTMVQGVVEDPEHPERYPQVRDTMKKMRVTPSPTSAAASIASLAASVAGLTGTGEVGAFTAMLKRSYKNQLVRRVNTHGGSEGWPVWIGQPLEELADAARVELDKVVGTQANRNEPGPAQRALALLAMAAHGSNPALINYTDSASGKAVRRPSSMTINGRARVKDATHDAHVIVFNMAQSRRGLDQLEAIVAASVHHDEPILPVDPLDGSPLLEDDLRRLWARTPELNGTPRPLDDAADGSGAGTDGEADVNPPDPAELSTERAWSQKVSEFREELRYLGSEALMLTDVPAGWEVLGISQEEWDPGDDTTQRMLVAQGIDAETAEAFAEDLAKVQRFFSDGSVAWWRNRAGQ